MDLHFGRSDYDNLFDAVSYLRNRFTVSEEDDISDEEYQAFYMLSYHQFYSSYGPALNNNEATLLELAGGPAIFPIISAVPHVKEIVFSDYVASCRKEVQLWKEDSPNAHNWRAYFRHVVQKLEGLPREMVAEREAQLRSKMTSIIHCDIYQDSILTPPQKPFDVVSCNNMLGPVSKSIDEFRLNCAKVASLVKPGGYLTLIQSESGSYYKLASDSSELFHSLFITSEQFHKAITDAGFKILLSKKKDAPEAPENIPGNRKSMMFVAAIKTQ